MQHQFFLQVHAAESALLRILGTVERRNFRLVSVHADTSNSNNWELNLTVEGERSSQQLKAQLAKLQDCRHVEVLEPLTVLPAQLLAS